MPADIRIYFLWHRNFNLAARQKERKKERRSAKQETPGGTPVTCVRAQLGGRAEDITSRLAPVIKREGLGCSADPEGPPRGQHGQWRLWQAWGGRAGAWHGGRCTAAALRPGGTVGCSETERRASVTARAAGGGETCR